MRASLDGQKIGIVGLGRSGYAAARLALARDARVYASDAGEGEDVRAAAERIRELGGEADVGGHDVQRLARCDRIVVSPGIPPGAPIFSEPDLRRVPIVAEVEFAWGMLDCPVVAITGTNGKTTVTGLISAALEAAGRRAPASGNIGRALSEIALASPPPDVAVVEVSSFQLRRTVTFAPRIGILTNLSPDHLDWYDTAEEYYADKARLFRNAVTRSRWVVNGEDPRVREMVAGVPGRPYWFRVDSEAEPGEMGARRQDDGTLVLRVEEESEEVLLHEDELRLLGRHNVANALAAALAARLMGAPPEAVRRACRSFSPPPHRLEPVAEVEGVLWINDSKATNLSSARVGIRSVDRPLVLLLGGKHKGEEYAELAPEVAEGVRCVLAFGEAAPRIARALGDRIRVEEIGGDLGEVVARARREARPGDAVLLSPACSSFDMFRDYEERGDRFRALVRGTEA